MSLEPDTLLRQDGHQEPQRFSREALDWRPWLVPLNADALEPRHWDGLVDPARARSDYFMLLAHDPEILGARTRTDKDIFHNPEGGLPRAERELAATATSRLNGCIFCASVHARFAVQHARASEAIDRLLEQGERVVLAPRWQALVDAAFALAATPPRLEDRHLERLRELGLDEAALLDLIQSSAFFNWANRLMLSLGQAVEAPVHG